jgi:ADP-heptose:LPS heptosyltransferase
MSLVLVPECRKLFPSSRIEILLRESLTSLFQSGAGLDKVLEFNPKFLKRPLQALRLLLHLRKSRYDLVLVCDTPYKSSFTSLCLSRWTRAKYVVAFNNEESVGFANILVNPEPATPMISNLLRLLSPFGATLPLALPSLKCPFEDLDRASLILEGTMTPVLIFVSSHWRKSFPLSFYLDTAASLIREGHHVVLAFGPGDEKCGNLLIQNWIESSCGLGRILSPQKLPIFAAVAAKCRLFISNDCGPYHIAVAVGIPCVAVFRSAEGCRDFGYHYPPRLISMYSNDPVAARESVLKVSLKILNERADTLKV